MPTDFIVTPLAGLFDFAGKWLLDLDLVELVLQLPSLSWGEFATSLAAVLGWKCLSDPFDRAITRRVRLLLAAALVQVAEWVRPA